MTNIQKISLLALRVTMGWMFFYAGITKVMDSSWSAEGYLKGAKALAPMYEFFMSPAVLPIINFLNAWGLTLLGASLVLGVFVRVSAPLGMLLMFLYYLALGFPMPNPHAYIVDEHIIYIAGLLVLFAFDAGRVWGLGKFLKR
jgi:thiosulfate dehydrogenase (quinone) large subunit